MTQASALRNAAGQSVPECAISIRQRLALSATVIVLVVVGVIAAAAYREVRRSAIAAASQHVENVSRQLGDLYVASERQLLDRARSEAAKAPVAAFLRDRDEETSREVLATL